MSAAGPLITCCTKTCYFLSVFNLLPYNFTKCLPSLVLSQGTKLSQRRFFSTLLVPFLTLSTIIVFSFKCLLCEMNNPNHFNLCMDFLSSQSFLLPSSQYLQPLLCTVFCWQMVQPLLQPVFFSYNGCVVFIDVFLSAVLRQSNAGFFFLNIVGG